MIPVASVKSALLPALVSSDLDQSIEEMIDNATATLGRDLGRYLGPKITSVEVYAGGRAVVILNDDPVEGSSLSVKTRTNTVTPWATITDIPAASYMLENRRLFHSSCWPRGFASVQVTYVKGFDEGNGPSELRGIVLDMVLERWRRNVAANASAEAGAFKSETIGDYSYTNFEGGVDTGAIDPGTIAGWAQIAARWRRRRAG